MKQSTVAGILLCFTAHGARINKRQVQDWGNIRIGGFDSTQHVQQIQDDIQDVQDDIQDDVQHATKLQHVHDSYSSLGRGFCRDADMSSRDRYGKWKMGVSTVACQSWCQRDSTCVGVATKLSDGSCWVYGSLSHAPAGFEQVRGNGGKTINRADGQSGVECFKRQKAQPQGRRRQQPAYQVRRRQQPDYQHRRRQQPAWTPTCESGWTRSGQSCFRFFSQKLPYTSAASLCDQHSATLAIVRSQAENNVVASLAGSSSANWIGLGLKRDGALRWPDGTTPTYQAVWHEKPSFSGFGSGDECVRIMGAEHSWKPGQWDDWDCSKPTSSVCSKHTQGSPRPIHEPSYVERRNMDRRAIRVACEQKSHRTFPECQLSSFSSCNGEVWYGRGDHWMHRTVQGNFDCNNKFFGRDPFPMQAKECICHKVAAQHAPNVNALAAFFKTRDGLNLFFRDDAHKRAVKEIDSNNGLRVAKLKKLTAFLATRDGLNLFYPGDACTKALAALKKQPTLRVDKLKDLTAYYRSREGGNNWYTGDAAKKALPHMTADYGPYLKVFLFKKNKQSAIEDAKLAEKAANLPFYPYRRV